MDKKELIIIVYKIGIGGLTKQQYEEQVKNIMNICSFSKDEELKENYIIREIWIPTTDDSDVKIIYPVTPQSDYNLMDLSAEISKRIKESPDETLKRCWDNLVRELKLKSIYDNYQI